MNNIILILLVIIIVVTVFIEYDNSSSKQDHYSISNHYINKRRYLEDVTNDITTNDTNDTTTTNDTSTNTTNDTTTTNDNDNDPFKKIIINEISPIYTDNKPDFQLAKQLSQKLLSLIRSRYQIDSIIGSNFIRTTQNIGDITWDIIKYKYAKKIITENSNFLMIFGGSSVTAGHDNYYNQSYPLILKKRMLPIFNSLKIDLKIHNIAQGANNCIPYNLCLEAMGGNDPDFISWEQSYNCGRDEPIFELVGRIAAFSANKAVVYFAASGAWTPDKCPESQDNPPYSSEDWTPQSAGIKEWEPTIADVNNERKLFNDFNKASQSSKRFSNILNDVKSVAAHGFNVWETNPLCTYQKDGKEQKNCNGIDSVMQCGLKFLTKEAALYGSDNNKGAGWHPTRAFHMLRGEFIAYVYTLILLDAIHMVEDQLKSHKTEELVKLYDDKLKALQPPFPGPKRCQSYRCEEKPLCYTDFKPHYNPKHTLSELVVGKTEWLYEAEEYGDWSLHYGYLDAKPLWYAPGPESGEIHLKIEVNHINEIWLCGNNKESLMHSTIYLDKNVEKRLDDYVPGNDRILWEKKKYVGNECKSITDLPYGIHVLSVATNTSHANHKTSISHLIQWP